MLTKKQLQDALNEAGIDVTNSATIPQLRQLYDRHIRQQVDAVIHQPQEVPNEAWCDAVAINDEASKSQDGDNDLSNDSNKNDNNADELRGANAVVGTSDVQEIVVTNEDLLNNLDTELALLEKRKRVALLRAELMTLEENRHDSHQKPTRRLDYADVQCAILPFSGDDAYGIAKWLDDYRRIMDSFDADENLRLLFARRLMNGSAGMLLRTVSANTWPELQQELLLEFDRRVDRKDVYKQLGERFIRPGEPVRQYVLSMQAIAHQVDIEERELVHFIIDGLRDASPAVSILYGARTLASLKDLLMEYERYRLRSPKASAAMAPAARPSSSYGTRPSPATQREVTTAEPVRCFNCREFGHISAACPRPRRPPGGCFKCFETSHIYKDCPLKRRVGLVAAQAETTTATNAQPEEAPLENEISVLQLVSVTIPSDLTGHVICLGLILSLFDTGSPVSFVQKSVLPVGVPSDQLFLSRYKGMGDSKIFTYGTANLLIQFGNISNLISVVVVPDSILPTPFLYCLVVTFWHFLVLAFVFLHTRRSNMAGLIFFVM